MFIASSSENPTRTHRTPYLGTDLDPRRLPQDGAHHPYICKKRLGLKKSCEGICGRRRHRTSRHRSCASSSSEYAYSPVPVARLTEKTAAASVRCTCHRHAPRLLVRGASRYHLVDCGDIGYPAVQFCTCPADSHDHRCQSFTRQMPRGQSSDSNFLPAQRRKGPAERFLCMTRPLSTHIICKAHNTSTPAYGRVS